MWSKRIVEWTEGNIAYISVVFTWDLPRAYSRCVWYSSQGFDVYAGGPAVSLMPAYLSGVANIGRIEVDALWRHNPNATFTSRGCIRRCKYCAVPKIEGELVELENWEPKAIVCDNNLLACSKKHFDKVIDQLKLLKDIDFNQGLDARLFKPYHLERLRELDCSKLRFAWDGIHLENKVIATLEQVLKSGFPKNKIGVYVLFNFEDTLEDTLYRCETLKGMGILPNVQRYQPLDCLIKNSYVASNWNKKLLADFTRYWSRQIYLRPIPFSEYRRHTRSHIPAEQLALQSTLK